MVDDPQYLFGMGYTFRSGRWFLGILGSLVRWFTGSPNFSLPLYSGIVCLAVLALCACVLIPLLGFTIKWEWVLTAGLMTVFPAVTGYFGFLFTAPYYLVGLLLCLLGCSVLCRYRKWWAYVLGIVLLALSTGIYQAFIPTALCVMLLHPAKADAGGELELERPCKRCFVVCFGVSGFPGIVQPDEQALPGCDPFDFDRL